MFRAMALPGVPVATVDDLDNYGLLTQHLRPTAAGEDPRDRYKPVIYSTSHRDRARVMEFLGQTGLDALKGADVLKRRPRDVLV